MRKKLYILCLILLGVSYTRVYAADAPAGDGLLALLGIDPQTIIIQVIGFLVVLIVLNKFVFGKVGGLLDERRNQITTQLEQLKTDREELDRLTAETRQRLSDIETEAQTKIQAAIEQGNVERQQIVTQARQDAEEEITRAQGRNTTAKKMMLFLNLEVWSLNWLLMQLEKSSVLNSLLKDIKISLIHP